MVIIHELTIQEVVDRSHATSVSKGWYEDERSFGDIIALIHSEASEALEAYRNGEPDYWERGDEKPEGALAELADIIIRIGDYCGKKKWDLSHALLRKMSYNEKRPHRHGGKKL